MFLIVVSEKYAGKNVTKYTSEPQADASWMTRNVNNAKQYKTRSGAERWIKARNLETECTVVEMKE